MSELPYQQALLSYRTFSKIVQSFPGLIHTMLCPNFKLSLVWLERYFIPSTSFNILTAEWSWGKDVGLSLVCLVEQVEVTKAHFLTSMFLPFTKNHGDSVAVINTAVILPCSFLSCKQLHQHSPLSPFLPFSLLLLVLAMKFAFEIKTKPVTQAAIIVTIVTLVSVFGSVVLAVIIYLALQLAPL